jgi:hypothetical protein
MCIFFRCSKDNGPPPFSWTVLPFDMVALAFMQLGPSFERISNCIPYVTFRFNFENIRR